MTVTAFDPQPLRIGQILDRAVRLYRRNFLKFIGIIAVVEIPMALLTAAINSAAQIWTLQGASLNVPATAMGGSFALSILSLVLNVIQGILRVLASAAIVRNLADQFLGKSSGILETYRDLGSSWKTIIGTLFLSGIVNLLLFILLIVPCIGWLSGLGLLFFYAAVVQQLLAPVVTLEQQSAGGTLRRAWDLARRRFWPCIGFVGVLYLLTLLFSIGPTALLFSGIMFSAEIFPSLDAAALVLVEQVASSVVGTVLGLILLPLQAIAVCLMYIDLRVRTEGFDLAWKVQTSTDLEYQWPAAPVPATGSLITWEDFGHFSVLSLAFGAVIALIYGILFVIAISSGALPL